MKRWQTRSLKLTVLAALGCLTPALAHADIKLGLDAVQMAGAKYTHDAAGIKDEDRSFMVGSQVSLELLPTEQFGLEVSYSLSPLERSYQLGIAGATSNNVTEQASYTTIGANMYLFYKKRDGFHPVIGVATGTLTVAQKFEGGTLGNISTTNTVNINIIKLGLEWVINSAGFRLQYQQWAGETNNTTKIAGVRQTNSYDGSAISLGVFSYFL
jgi:hypothetical protein